MKDSSALFTQSPFVRAVLDAELPPIPMPTPQAAALDDGHRPEGCLTHCSSARGHVAEDGGAAPRWEGGGDSGEELQLALTPPGWATDALSRSTHSPVGSGGGSAVASASAGAGQRGEAVPPGHTVLAANPTLLLALQVRATRRLPARVFGPVTVGRV